MDVTWDRQLYRVAREGYLSAISETIPVGYRFLFIFLVTSIIYLFIYLFGVELIYNGVLVSGVQHSDSVLYVCVCSHICIYTHVYISIYSFSDSVPIIGYDKILSIVSVLYGRSLLFICFIYRSIYLLIPNS